MSLIMTFQQIRRIFEEPQKSYFLFGPRGTGKSTMASSRHPKALLIDLRIATERLRFLSNPDHLLTLVRGQPALRPYSIMDTSTEIEGAALEGLVAQHLIAWRDYSLEKHTINFWRTRSGVEVDFIVFGPLGFWAIEVKNSRTVHPSDLRALNSFIEDYPEASALFLYRGTQRLQIKNVLCLPCEQFLKEMTPNLPLEASFGKDS